MPTGACGINCNVCKLKLMGICSTCGSGKSREAALKLEAQKRIFQNTCSILACACMKKVEYCLRDCNLFPCENFSLGPYPFSDAFLSMQQRRREDKPPAINHLGAPIVVPDQYWIDLKEKDVNFLLNLTFFESVSSRELVFRFLNEDILVDIENRCLKRFNNGVWKKTDDQLLEIITLVYLNSVDSFYPLGNDIISKNELKEAHFFKGFHDLKTAPLLERYGNDISGFKEAARYLGGKPMEMADAAYRLLPFPRVCLYYLFWKGDEEFNPKISILFDRSIEKYFSASGIWGLVNLVSFALLKGSK